MSETRVIGRPFQPGQSGNPAGRTPISHDVKTLAKKNTKRAFEKILELIDSDDERVALTAAKEVLDRAWGKPATSDDADTEKRNVTINIVRYGDHQSPPQLESEAVSVRTVEVPGGWGEEGGSRLS